jgi:hypothetical protein
MAADRPSVNPKPGTKTLQIWRNAAGVLHVGKNGWEAMIVYEGGKLVALGKTEKTWMHHDLSPTEWKRVQAELEKDKRNKS